MRCARDGLSGVAGRRCSRSRAWGAGRGAEPVLELAKGSQPTAVTDAAGTLHVVFRSSRSRPRCMYCRVPAGGGPCTPVQIARDAARRICSCARRTAC